MTYEEAQAVIISCKNYELGNRFLTAFDLAIEAIEKQIPKKPIKRMALFDLRQCCPVCRDVLCRPYPCTCGQAIDWSDEE